MLFCMKPHISSNYIDFFSLETLVIMILAYVTLRKKCSVSSENKYELSGVGRGSNCLLINIFPATNKRRNAFWGTNSEKSIR